MLTLIALSLSAWDELRATMMYLFPGLKPLMRRMTDHPTACDSKLVTTVTQILIDCQQ